MKRSCAVKNCQQSKVVLFVLFFLLCFASAGLAASAEKMEVFDRQWLESEIAKTRTEIEKETDPEKKIQFLDYLERLDRLQQAGEKEADNAEDGWAAVDFVVKREQSYLDYNPVGGWADGKYELKGVKFVKAGKKNIWELHLGFMMEKSGWQQYKKVVQCLMYYDGNLFEIKDEKGARTSLNVRHKEPEVVIEKNAAGDKRITRRAMTRTVDFDINSGHVHLVLEF
ncbi:MAG TPA: hypothetical protein DCX54_02790 [Flavobacteriales bacterium]|nr:hypothetical protein [Flavobacteriales bacterium]